MRIRIARSKGSAIQYPRNVLAARIRTFMVIARTRATVVAIVFAFLCVPALVRAAGPLETTNRTPILRLNRGVDVPESKCRVTASQVIAIIDPDAIGEVPAPHRAVFEISSAQALADTPAVPAAILRGPPSATA